MTINLHYHLGRLSQKPWNRAYVTGDGEHVRQLIQASHLLARARATTKKSQSQSLAKTALTEADDEIAISPDDAAGHIVRRHLICDMRLYDTLS
ncbi:unnamed protein product [Brassica napus]|uniref:(rape) hypothetical protein n=1 Tax=Brassica napus TaxID=3708 RepID=A0A816QLE5_BRANA|nr:unnamed protein product [Brassica napus]